MLIPRFAPIRAKRFHGQHLIELTDGFFAETLQGLQELRYSYGDEGMIHPHPSHPEIDVWNNYSPRSYSMNAMAPVLEFDHRLYDPQSGSPLDSTQTWIDQIWDHQGHNYLRTDGSIWRYSPLRRTIDNPRNPNLSRWAHVPWENRSAILPPFRLHRIGTLPMDILDATATTKGHQ